MVKYQEDRKTEIEKYFEGQAELVDNRQLSNNFLKMHNNWFVLYKEKLPKQWVECIEEARGHS